MKGGLLFAAALFPLLASAVNYDEVVKTITESMKNSVAGGGNKLTFKECKDLSDDQKKSLASFPQPAENKAKDSEGHIEPCSLLTTAPDDTNAKDKAITQELLLGYGCAYMEKREEDDPLFCYQVWIKPEKTSNAGGDEKAEKKSKKKPTFVALLFLGNRVVTSRIKAFLTTHNKSALLGPVIELGVTKYLSKTAQSLVSLSDLDALLDVSDKSHIRELMDQLLEEMKEDRDLKLEVTFDKWAVIREKTRAEAAKKMAEAFKEKKTAERRQFELNQLLGSLAAEQEPVEVLVVTINEKPDPNEKDSPFEELMRSVDLVIVNVDGRYSVHLLSLVYSYSRGLSLPTKPGVMQTVQFLLRVYLVEYYKWFHSLDNDDPLESDDIQANLAAKGKGKDALGPAKPQTKDLQDMFEQWFSDPSDQDFSDISRSLPVMFSPMTPGNDGEPTYGMAAQIGKYTIFLAGGVLPKHGDFEVRVTLVKTANPRNAVWSRVSFFPLRSLFSVKPLIKSFVIKVVLEFYEFIYGEFVAPVRPSLPAIVQEEPAKPETDTSTAPQEEKDLELPAQTEDVIWERQARIGLTLADILPHYFVPNKQLADLLKITRKGAAITSPYFALPGTTPATGVIHLVTKTQEPTMIASRIFKNKSSAVKQEWFTSYNVRSYVFTFEVAK